MTQTYFCLIMLQLFLYVTVESYFEFSALAEGSIEYSDLSGRQSDLQSDEAVQVCLFFKHVLADQFVVVVQALNLNEIFYIFLLPLIPQQSMGLGINKSANCGTKTLQRKLLGFTMPFLLDTGNIGICQFFYCPYISSGIIYFCIFS